MADWGIRGMPPTKFWAEMTWRDFAAADMSKVVAVLPVAAIEQHGPHLPVGVDAFIGEGYLKRVVARLPAECPVLFLPLQAIGTSDEHGEYPGTLTLPLETLTRAWTEIGDSVARTGCRKLVFINSHGGNVPVDRRRGARLRVRHRMLAVHAAWRRLGYPDGLFSARERAHGIHGGDAETSLMLAFRPDAVKMDEARDFGSAGGAMEREFEQLRVDAADRLRLDGERPQSRRARSATPPRPPQGRGGAEHGADGLPRAAARRPRLRSCSARDGPLG